MVTLVRYISLFGLLGSFLVSIVGCAGIVDHGPPYWPLESWRTSSPEQQGMDSGLLAGAFDLIKQKELPIHSLLIIRHGYLVLEAYIYPYSGNSLHDWASVTKSITSTLVGQAIDEGYIKNLEQPIQDFFPDYRDALSDAKRRITVEDLLMMATGLDCGYKQGELEALAMLRSKDFVASVLNLPMATEPGRVFSYCSGGMHLLSAIVTRSTRMCTIDFARLRLFGPLGIKEVIWPADPQGVNHGWADLRMHPRDMAKIGYLYLHRGSWDGKQVLSSDWVRRSTRREIRARKNEDYGYGWWIRTDMYRGIYEALGRGGQSVSIWPDKDLIVVINGAGFDRGHLAPSLLEALKSDKPLPENLQAFQHLQASISAASKPPEPRPVPILPDMAKNVSGRAYILEPNLLGIKTITLRFEGTEEAQLKYVLVDQTLEAPVGLDGRYRFSPPSPSQLILAAKGYWNTKNEFIVDYTEANGINHFIIRHVFKDDSITFSLDDLTGHFPAQLAIGRASN